MQIPNISDLNQKKNLILMTMIDIKYIYINNLNNFSKLQTEKYINIHFY